MRRVIVAGCGLGGLSAAIRCATQGAQVTVFEKNNAPGGKAGQRFLNAYRFDCGPSLLTLPEVLNEILQEEASSLTLIPLSDICRYFWGGEKQVTSTVDSHRFNQQFHTVFGEPPTHYLRFQALCRRLYRSVATLFLSHAIHHPSVLSARRFWSSLIRLPFINGHHSLYRTVQRYFQAPEIQQLFMRFATYNGSSPYRAPGTLSVISHIEHTLGAYAVKEGIHAIPQALERRARNVGVEFRYNEALTAIATHQRGWHKRVTGIETDQGYYRCHTLISNMDVVHTHTLIGQPEERTIVCPDRDLSTSALVFLWGIDKSFDSLLLHNILFSGDYRQEFRELFDMGMVPQDPTIYINVSSKINSHDAPPGKENWFVMINTPPHRTIQWDAVVDRTRWIVQKKISEVLGCEIGRHIECEEVLTPRHFAEMTNAFQGSLYGRSSNSLRYSFLRPANYSYRYQGLYFCGGTVHPGGGIPLALLSGYIAANLALKNRNSASLIQ